jgi:hypothetical protein
MNVNALCVHIRVCTRVRAEDEVSDGEVGVGEVWVHGYWCAGTGFVTGHKIVTRTHTRHGLPIPVLFPRNTCILHQQNVHCLWLSFRVCHRHHRPTDRKVLNFSQLCHFCTKYLQALIK